MPGGGSAMGSVTRRSCVGPHRLETCEASRAPDEHRKIVQRQLDPTDLQTARDKLRRVLILDQRDRDAIAAELLGLRRCQRRRVGSPDRHSLHPEVRRREARLLAESGAESQANEMNIEQEGDQDAPGRCPGMDDPRRRCTGAG